VLAIVRDVPGAHRYAFPMPLEVPTASPVHGVGTVPRPSVGAIDRGAYEHGSSPLPVDGGVAPGTDAGPASDAGIASDAGSGGDGGAGVDADVIVHGADAGTAALSGGCGWSWLALGVMLAIAVRRRLR
jgi:hypothetical protein